MVGFCGSCGTPRQSGASFCMNCGGAFPEDRACPTCGQMWPASVPWPVESPQAYEPETWNESDVERPKTWRVGLYYAKDRRVYFDGAHWSETELRQGKHTAVPNAILNSFDPEDVGAVLLFAEDRGGGGTRAPLIGPDYVPNTDCGNCGYPIEKVGDSCAVCGTTNLGPEFNPAALNE